MKSFIANSINHVWKSLNTLISNNAFHGTNPSIKIINNTEKTRIAEVLVDRANENGGGDNISVAAISY